TGPLPPGYLADGERHGILAVIGTTLCTYTQLVRALGGWQALPTNEDIALLLAAEAVANGWMIATPRLYYPRWTGNTTQHIDKIPPTAPSPPRTVILDRVNALQATGWRWSPTHAWQTITARA